MKLAYGIAPLTLCMLAGGQAAFAQDSLTVAYFMEWPLPFQYAKAEGIYDERLGVPVNWVAFDTGTAMSAAMAAGDVQIAVSQGVPPFISAASAGQDLRIIGVAASYPENENCVVAARLEIDKDSANELEGLRVALPAGSGAHYGFLQQMEHFGVDVGTMTVVDMAPAEGAAAFEQGSVDMACGWGGALTRMLEHGNVLLTGDEKEEIGVLSSDVISTTSRFAAQNPELLAEFMAVTEEVNDMWSAGDKRDQMLPLIANDAGMDETGAGAVIDNFAFLTAEQQLSENWLGGGVANYLDGVANLFFEMGSLSTVLPSYDDLIDTQPLANSVER
ncbi:ABC transporter substrate-binding protein [Paracoccus sp. Z330]|uniref:ABC transporter substrate-binding protein n=1 Tax=Paracoccus onchidii TaxID=3017813 RepID=A0ABT4ZFH5_9RHOB|nr:ABC transporter substrate-binding protein [Paracoccus onchidii]MDB6177713.1 ABC transporter substrate-binding protein [Paracoccus onchidii]